MARALHGPIGSGVAMSWWRRWPTHGGRGPKPLEGRVAVAHVDCCVLWLCGCVVATYLVVTMCVYKAPANFIIPKLPTEFPFGIRYENTGKIPKGSYQKYRFGIQLYTLRPTIPHKIPLAEKGYFTYLRMHKTKHVLKREGICLENLPPR